MSGSVRDVCMSHQSDWIYYQTPIKFPVVKVNGMCEDLIPIKLRTAIFLKEEEVFIHWVYLNSFCGLG